MLALTYQTLCSFWAKKSLAQGAECGTGWCMTGSGGRGTPGLASRNSVAQFGPPPPAVTADLLRASAARYSSAQLPAAAKSATPGAANQKNRQCLFSKKGAYQHRGKRPSFLQCIWGGRGLFIFLRRRQRQSQDSTKTQRQFSPLSVSRFNVCSIELTVDPAVSCCATGAGADGGRDWVGLRSSHST